MMAGLNFLFVENLTRFLFLNSFQLYKSNLFGINKRKALFNATFVQTFYHLGGDIDVFPSVRSIKPQFFSV